MQYVASSSSFSWTCNFLFFFFSFLFSHFDIKKMNLPFNNIFLIKLEVVVNSWDPFNSLIDWYGNINKTKKKKQAILAALVVVDVSSVCIYYSLQVDFVGFVVGLLVFRLYNYWLIRQPNARILIQFTIYNLLTYLLLYSCSGIIINSSSSTTTPRLGIFFQIPTNWKNICIRKNIIGVYVI